MEKKLTYIAVPYTSDDSAVTEERFRKVSRVAAKLINSGEFLISPISMCHPISQEGGLPGDWEFWDEYDKAIIACCYKLYVLMLDGWKESTGVQAEIKIAKELGLEIVYIDYDDIMEINEN